MKHEIIIAGFGGQGVLSMGKILAYSGLLDGLEVTWMPSYGPEQRGGTANVTVILSDSMISSPVLDTYDIAVILNQQSLDKFESHIKPGGTLIYDPYGIHRQPARTDIRCLAINATDAAVEMGNSKAYNMILLGALLETVPMVTHTHSQTHSLIQTHTFTHTQTHSYTNTHTHTHTTYRYSHT